MIEEAAGTRMYETKKQQAQKTIEKKDAKLKELNDVSYKLVLSGQAESYINFTGCLRFPQNLQGFLAVLINKH